MNRGYAICIDTYACGGGRLTCMDSESGRVWQAGEDLRVSRSQITDFGDAS